MVAPRNRLGEILVKARVIDEMQLRGALAQHAQKGGRLSRIIADMGLASEDTLTDAIARELGIERVRLGTTRDPDALAKLDVDTAEQKGLFPVSLRDDGKTLVLAMADPTDQRTIDQVAARGHTRVIPVVAGDREIQHAILRHYRDQEPAVPPPAANRSSSLGDENTTAPSRPGGGASAAELLEEILSTSPSLAQVFSPQEMQRLRTVQATQEKNSKILRALLELLLEKGTIQQRELAARLRPS